MTQHNKKYIILYNEQTTRKENIKIDKMTNIQHFTLNYRNQLVHS